MKQRITPRDLKSLTEEQERRLNELWIPSTFDVVIAKVVKNVATEEILEYPFVVGGISLYGTSVYLQDITAVRAALQAQSQDPEAETEAKVQKTEEPPLSVKVDTFFGAGYPGFGNRNDVYRAAEGMEEAVRDEKDDGQGEQEEDAQEDEEDGCDNGDYQEDGQEDDARHEFSEEDLEDNYQLPSMFIKDECLPLLTIGNMIEILKNNNYGKFDFFISACTYDIGCELGKGDSSWGNFSDWEPAELCDVLWESVKALL